MSTSLHSSIIVESRWRNIYRLSPRLKRATPIISEAIIVLMTKNPFEYQRQVAADRATWMDELFLRKHIIPRRISPLAQEKRAQGSRRLCNHDYTAAYAEVEHQVRPRVSPLYMYTGLTAIRPFAALSNARSRSAVLACSALEQETMRKFMRGWCNSKAAEIVRRYVTLPSGAFSQFYLDRCNLARFSMPIDLTVSSRPELIRRARAVINYVWCVYAREIA